MAPSKVADRATVNSNTASATHDYALTGLTIGNILIIRTAADNAGGGGAAVTVTVTNQSGTAISTSTDLAYQQNCDPGAASAGTTCNVILAEITATSGTVRITYGASVVQAGIAEEWTGLAAIGSIIVQTPVGAARTTANTALSSAVLSGVVSGNLFYAADAVEGPASDTYTQDTDTTNGSWSDLTKAGTSLGTVDLNQTVHGGYKVVTGTGLQTHNSSISTARESAALGLELAVATVLDGTATPATIARSFVVATATASGPATVAPATIAQAFALSAPTISAGSTLAPSVIARSFTLPAPTAFRWTLAEWMGRFDDGDEDSATEIGVPFTTAGGLPANGLWGDQDRWHPFRLRATIQAGASSVTVTPKLQYKIPLETPTDWTDVDATTTVVRLYPSEYVTDGTATTAVAGVGTGTFVAGTVETSSAAAGAVSLGAGEHTEVEWCVVNATASQGSEVWFRVADSGVAWTQTSGIDELVVCENPTYSQIEFRGRNDDGSQTTATWKAADNTNWSQEPDVTFRCRFLIRVIQVHPSYRELFRLQRRVNAGAWDYVTTTSTVVKAVTSANFADEDTTTQQLSADATFLPGRMSEDGVASDDWSFDWNPEQSFISANRTELEFALQIVDADTATSDVVQLRVLNYREAFTVDAGGAYTQTPSITVAAPSAGGTATPATIARSFTVETAGATGGGTVAPATLARVFLQPAPSVSVGSTLAPATIARSFLQPAPALSAGSTVTAPLIARDILLPAPAATGGGSATATPAVIVGAFTLPAPTTSSGSSATPAVIARSITLPAPTVTGGTGATAAPAVITGAFVVVAPAVSVGSTLTPATIARSILVPNPAASGGGSASVAPAVITGAFTVPAPTVTAGGSVAPAVSALSALLSAPTVSGGGTATPAVIARSIGVPNPSASGSSAGTASPATIARSFTQPAPSLSTGSSTTPATIARSVLVPAASATGGTAATPATIARSFLQPTPALSYGSTLTVTPIAVAVILPAPASTGGGTKTPAVIARQFALPAPTATGGGTAFPATIVLFILLPTVGAQGSIYPDFAPYVRAYVLDARRAYRLTGARTYTVNGQRVYRR